MIATCQEFLGSFWIYLMKSEMKQYDKFLQEAGRELK